MTKKPATKDWHKEQIKARVRMEGTTLKGLALANGYRSVDACAQALQRPYPKMERIIAAKIGVRPEDIWPSRYVNNKTKFTSPAAKHNVNPAVAI